jgi:hypothetical protein
MKKIIRLNESQLKEIIVKIIKENSENVYFNTFSGAVQHARKVTEDKGYEVDENDWFNRVNVGRGKPKEDETNRMTIGLTKDGKPSKKALHIQVYNRGNSVKNNYELNFYVS